MDEVTTDLAAHRYTAALVSALTLIAALAQQGKIQPFLARFSPWTKTLALLALVQAGVGAQAYASGLPVVVAVGRALPPLIVVFAVHYLGVPAQPAVTAQKTADVAAATAAAAPKVPAGLAVLAFYIGVAFALIAFPASLQGCNAAEQAEAKTVVSDIEHSPLVTDQIDCVLKAYKAGVEDVRQLGGICVPLLVTDATKQLTATPDAGGAGGGK